jgi:AhpD family alkylhydroperoxidase
MGKDFSDITGSVSKSLRKLRADIPEVTSAFTTLAQAATAEGALDHKTKELIALALGVAAHCDACIGFHVKALVKAGATRAELAETLGMAVYMGGGPSLMYAAEAVSAWEQFTATQPAPTDGATAGTTSRLVGERTEPAMQQP